MKKIVALQDKGNSGKTMTVKLVFDKLKAKYPAASVNIYKCNPDIKVVMNINGIKIGIESRGDPNSRLKKSLSFFVNEKCAIIICSARLRGMTVDWINEYANQYHIEYVKQTYESQSNKQSAVNNATADKMISKAGL